MPATSTTSDTGRFGRKRLPAIRRRSAAAPSASDAGFVSPRCERKWPIRSQKSPWLPLKPKSFGSCVLARCRATPVLKPVITVSEMKLTRLPARRSQAARPRAETRRAVAAASAAWRAGSPAATSASDAPTRSEIADVTVTAVCCELQKSQNTSPANRHE